VSEALSDAERAVARLRARGHDSQLSGVVLAVAARCLSADGRREEADAVLAEALEWSRVGSEDAIYELPLHLVELGRGGEYLELTEGRRGYHWLDAGRAVASGDLVRGSELYGEIGARFVEAWAALLAAEHGDPSRLDAALAYFEEQRATPYASRCRALLRASA
jgi:hypothetical protein